MLIAVRRAAALAAAASLLVLVAGLAGCAGTVSAPVSGRDTQTGRAPTVDDSQELPRPAPDLHTVVRGDTLYSIAWRYGQDYRTLARRNGIDDPFVIYPGQKLRLTTDADPPPSAPASAAVPPVAAAPADQAQPLPDPKATATVPASAAAASSGPLAWRWPTTGRLVRSDTPTSKKGLDIAGRLGQSIEAAAPGAVVYSGSGLLGYGRLIIIKHNDTFLSAYAHNESVFVKEGDRVAAGQRIATMGHSSGSSRPMLHFEIRKNGQPVNPLGYLPRRPA